MNVAVLGCLALVFVLVGGLVVSARVLSVRSERALVAAEGWSVAASDSGAAALLFDQWEGDGDLVRGRLLPVLESLSGSLASLDPERETPAGAELAEMLATATVHLESPESLRQAFALETDDLAEPFETVAEALSAAGREETETTIGRLHEWFVAVQVAAVISAVLFGLIVVTRVLPLSRSLSRTTRRLRRLNDQAAEQERRQTLTRQVVEGLEGSVDEAAAYDVIARAMVEIVPDRPAEMLLADSSRAHLRLAVPHPKAGGSGCGVVSPWSCPAVRRGSTQVFADSTAIRACPHLAEHTERCSAVCAPMTMLGEPMGVVHVTGPVGETDDHLVESIAMLATESATRVGALRAFAKAELQAATDVVTGLPNRRATERRLQSLVSEPTGGTVAMVEILGLAELGERAGRSASERALKVVAESITRTIREVDWGGRWAGAEFVVALPGASTVSREVIARLADRLVVDLESAGLWGLSPEITVVDARHARSGHDILQLVDGRRRPAAHSQDPRPVENSPDSAVVHTVSRPYR